MKRRKTQCFIGNDRSFGNALKYFREAAGLTQTETSELSELSQSAISRFEDGENWPCKETTFRLCHVYGITLLELFKFITDDLSKLPYWALEIRAVNLETRTNDDDNANE